MGAQIRGLQFGIHGKRTLVCCVRLGGRKKKVFIGQNFIERITGDAGAAAASTVPFDVPEQEFFFRYEDIIRKVDLPAELPLGLWALALQGFETEAASFQFEKNEALTFAREPNHRGRGKFFCDVCQATVDKEEIYLCDVCEGNVHSCVMDAALKPGWRFDDDDGYFCDALTEFQSCARKRRKADDVLDGGKGL